MKAQLEVHLRTFSLSEHLVVTPATYKLFIFQPVRSENVFQIYKLVRLQEA